MKDITGTMYSYSFLCNRKLWLFSHNITMEHNSENVSIGKEIDSNSYSRQEKHLMIDGTVNIDFIKDGIVYEIKKSSKQKAMAVNQIKYYLYTLKQKGITAPKGILCIPEERQREEVYLSDEDIEFIEKRLMEIQDILNNTKMPEVIQVKACKSCSYHDLCYV